MKTNMENPLNDKKRRDIELLKCPKGNLINCLSCLHLKKILRPKPDPLIESIAEERLLRGY